MIASSLAFLVCVVLSAVFSGMETGIYSLERVRLQVQAASGQRRAERLLGLVKNPAGAVGTILIANNLVNYGVALFSGLLLQQLITADLSDVELELRNTAYVVPVLFVLGELLPKRLFLRNPGLLVAFAYPVYAVAAWVLRPLVAPLNALVRWLMGKDAGGEALTTPQRRLEVLHMLTRGDEAELLTAPQRELAGRVLQLRGLLVAERMIRLGGIVSIAPDSPREEIVRRGVEGGVGRLPVRDPRGPGFLGYVNVIEVAACDPAACRLEALLHPMPQVRSDDSMRRALEVLQEARKPIAVVVGERGPVGLMTTSDIVEALVPGTGGVGGQPGGRGAGAAANPSSPDA